MEEMLSNSVGLLMFLTDCVLLGLLLDGKKGKKHTYCIGVWVCVCVYFK